MDSLMEMMSRTRVVRAKTRTAQRTMVKMSESGIVQCRIRGGRGCIVVVVDMWGEEELRSVETENIYVRVDM